MPASEYELRAEDFFQPERRKIRQMSFPNRTEEASAAAAELAGRQDLRRTDVGAQSERQRRHAWH